MRALLVGTPGRLPFAGHFRGRWSGGGTGLAWAGCVLGGATAEEGWEAAEAARDAMMGLRVGGEATGGGAGRFAAIDAAWQALRALNRREVVVLLVGEDADGVALAACGLADVRGGGRSVVEPGHPLLSEPGIPERPGYFHPETRAEEWVGVPVGGRWPEGEIAAACGARLP